MKFILSQTYGELDSFSNSEIKGVSVVKSDCNISNKEIETELFSTDKVDIFVSLVSIHPVLKNSDSDSYEIESSKDDTDLQDAEDLVYANPVLVITSPETITENEDNEDSEYITISVDSRLLEDGKSLHDIVSETFENCEDAGVYIRTSNVEKIVCNKSENKITFVTRNSTYSFQGDISYYLSKDCELTDIIDVI